jgi:hypothetical protein
VKKYAFPKKLLKRQLLKTLKRVYRLFSILFLPVLYFLLVGYYVSFLEYGFNIWDEGGYAYGTLRTLNGQSAFKDFNPNGYLPGRYLYGALFFKLFGISIQSLRLGVAIITPLMVFLTYAISRRIMPVGFSLLAALATLSAPSMYYNRFYPFFCILLAYLTIKIIETKRALIVFLSLFVCIVTVSFKVEVALFSALIICMTVCIMFLQGEWRDEVEKDKLSKDQKSKKIWILSAVGLAFGGLVVYALQRDLVWKVVDIVFATHDVWGNAFPNLFPISKVYEEIGLHKIVERLLFYLPILAYFLSLGILVYRVIKDKGHLDDHGLYVLATLAFGICSFGLVIWRAGFDNLLRTLPLFYILFCYLTYLAWKSIASSKLVQNNDGGWFFRIIANVLAVFLPFLFYYEMNTHHGYYAGSIGARNKEKVHLQMRRIDVYTNQTEANWLKGTVSRIKQYSQPGDSIFAIPLNPVFYYLTDRINPTLYDWILPGMLNKEKQLEAVEALKANPPKLILYVDIPIDGREDRRFANYAPIIFKYITDNYFLSELVGFFQILLPKEVRNQLEQLDPLEL